MIVVSYSYLRNDFSFCMQTPGQSAQMTAVANISVGLLCPVAKAFLFLQIRTINLEEPELWGQEQFPRWVTESSFVGAKLSDDTWRYNGDHWPFILWVLKDATNFSLPSSCRTNLKSLFWPPHYHNSDPTGQGINVEVVPTSLYV